MSYLFNTASRELDRTNTLRPRKAIPNSVIPMLTEVLIPHTPRPKEFFSLEARAHFKKEQ